MNQKQMPLKKLPEVDRHELETELYEEILKLEDRVAKEKERRSDWNKATGKKEKNIREIAKKLSEDDAALPEEI